MASMTGNCLTAQRGVLSKAKGQLARVALVLHGLEQAVSMCDLHEDNDGENVEEWSFTIQDSTVHHAVELINHFTEQKFSLMPAEERFEETDADLAQLTSEQAKFVTTNGPYIRKLVPAKHNVLTPSHISQLRLMPPTTNSMAPGKTRYPVMEAKQFLRNVVDLGLGTIQTVRAERMTSKGPVMGKQSIKLLKRKYSELEPQSLAILKRLKVTEDEYKSATANEQTSSASQQTEIPNDEGMDEDIPLSEIANTLP